MSDRKPYGFWTLENCLKDALSFKNRNIWHKKSRGAYASARKNGWIELCTLHMEKLGSHHKRLIYAFEFSDKSVYIGLTYNSKQRKNRHFNDINSKVYQYIQETNLIPIYIELTEYQNKDIAAINEGKFLEKYKQENWKILNVIRTGGLGGGIKKWSFNDCKNQALKYKNRSQWQANCPSYKAALRNKWVDLCSSHMSKKKIWTFEECVSDALKYRTRSEWRINSLAYRAAHRRNILHICCKHMP